MDIMHLIAEEKIREAIRRGEFDNLPGAGKPLPPDDLEGVPEELRVSFRILKNAGILPEEMQLRKEMTTLGDLIAACEHDGERQKLQRELTIKKVRYQQLMSNRGWHSSETYTEYQRQLQDKLTDQN